MKYFMLLLVFFVPLNIKANDSVTAKDVLMEYGVFLVNREKDTYDLVRETTEIECSDLIKSELYRFGFYMYSKSGNEFKVISKIKYDGANPHWKEWSIRRAGGSSYYLTSNIDRVLTVKSKYFNHILMVDGEYYDSIQFDLKNCEGCW